MKDRSRRCCWVIRSGRLRRWRTRDKRRFTTKSRRTRSREFMMKFWLVLLVVVHVGDARADWPMARGNAQRTGNVDGLAGPKSPKLLWGQESTDHFVSAPSPGDGMIFGPAVGTANNGGMSALSSEPGGAAGKG